MTCFQKSLSQLLFVLFVWSLTTEAAGQIPRATDETNHFRQISGIVTDASDNVPIPNVSVFIAGTSIGTTTDDNGYYKLRIPGEGSYRLTLSHVGYQPVFTEIKSGNQSIIADVALNIMELEEVTTTMKVVTRKKDVNLFWNTLLGKSPSKKTMYALNPEVVYYYYNPKTQKLTVTCREPLEIVNNETGYQIKVVVDHFTHDCQTEETSWKIEKVFTALEPKDERQRKQWQDQRKDIYQLSLAHFIRALYHNRLKEEGYVLTYLSKEDCPSNVSGDAALNAANFLSDAGADGGKTLRMPFASINAKGLILVCFGRPVTDNDLLQIVAVQNGNTPKFEISGRKITVPTRQTTSEALTWPDIGLVQNILTFSPALPITIYPDGTYSHPLKLNPLLRSNSLFGLHMMMPTEYIPETGSGGYSTFAQTAVSFEDKINSHFEQQLKIFPQEKIYLHTDKPYYISGERIWFRAHVVDAANHHPVCYSKYVYVELIDPVDSVVSRVKIREDEGAYHGHILIPDTVPEGDYTIRAYTLYMQSLDERDFFSKTVHIGDPLAISSQLASKGEGGLLSKAVTNKTPVRKPLHIPAPPDDYDVTFYPEGGALMEGTACKVAFKAMKANGQATAITGVVYDRNGVEICQIQTEHQGMGQFCLQAVKGQSYDAVCTDEKGQSKRFDLPPAISDGIALSVTVDNDSIVLKALKPVHTVRNNAHYDELYLLAHTRGKIHFAEPFHPENERLVFQKEQFPSGVLHFILFDVHMNPLSERLVFICNDDQATVSYHHDGDPFAARSLVQNTVIVTDREGEPLLGNFSVSVTSDREVTPDSTMNILTYLLLSSDVRGHIENPAFYFRDDDSSACALDLLMCTQGWRRYNIAELAMGRYEKPAMPVEAGSVMTGTVKLFAQKKTVKNMAVSIMSQDGQFETVKTDKDGRFSFNTNVFDSTRFIVHVPQNGRSPLEVILDRETFPKKTVPTVPPLAKIDPVQFSKYVEKAERKYTEDNGMRMVNLPEVAVAAQQPKKKPFESPYYFQEFLTPGSTITEEQISKYSGATPFLMLSQVPGISVGSVDGNKINFIRIGPIISLNHQPVPLLVIDNFTISSDSIKGFCDIINTIPISDIARIDVLKGPETSAFGMRGAGGVICIYTKQSAKTTTEEVLHNTKSITPLGFQKPDQFYAPKYDTSEKHTTSGTDLRTTIHWQPVVQIDNQGAASFAFYTADEQSTFTVVIEGVTSDGCLIRKESQLWK